jgi:hypothetical protein
MRRRGKQENYLRRGYGQLGCENYFQLAAIEDVLLKK